MQNYNNILKTIDISEESAPVTEPVTLEEMKNYLRQEGFIDDDDSTAIPDFEDDDTLLEEMITASREELEETLNVSLVNHTWQAQGLTNMASHKQFEYCPVKGKDNTLEITSLLDSEGTAYDITDEDVVKEVGGFLKYPNDCDMTAEYDVVITTVPKAVKLEIMRMVAYQYENRGEVDGLDGYKYSNSVMKYSRQEIFL